MHVFFITKHTFRPLGLTQQETLGVDPTPSHHAINDSGSPLTSVGVPQHLDLAEMDCGSSSAPDAYSLHVRLSYPMPCFPTSKST